MKSKRYSAEQIIGILKEAEAGIPVKEFCRKYGFSDATTYNWKSKYGGITCIPISGRELIGSVTAVAVSSTIQILSES